MKGVGIEVSALTKKWNDTTAVDAVSFSAAAGEFTVLLGPSGCGKSTTLRLIAGLEEATSGRILIDGADVTREPPNKRQIAMVFQSYALFPHLSVAENILFGLKVRRVPPREQNERLEKTAALLGLSDLLKRRPSQLSGGQQQRVALGRAIIAEKPICLMDEPLSNLDAKLRHEMRIELRALQQKLGLTMVYVTHDQAEAISMADKIIVLNAGRIEQAATPRALYETPASLFAARFIGTPPMNLLRLQRQAEGGWSVAGDAAVFAEGFEGPHPDELYLGVRPEDLSVSESGGLVGVVETIEYLGADNLIDCRVGSERLTARLSNRNRIGPGERLRLTWPQGGAHLFNGITGERLEEASRRFAGTSEASHSREDAALMAGSAQVVATP